MDFRMSFDQIMMLLVGGGIVWLLYTKTGEKCPNCSKRNRLGTGKRTTLEKEVRYKDVDREDKDSNGQVIRRYKEQVAVNYAKNRYDLTCKECGHNWNVTKWEGR